MTKKIILASILALYALAAQARPKERSLDEYWWLCPIDRSVPVRPEFSSEGIAPGSTEVRSDTARIVDQESTYFAGDAELLQGKTAIKANEITYDQQTESGSAEGDTSIWSDSFLWRGERALFDLNLSRSRLEHGRYWLIDRQGRGVADFIKRDGKDNITRLTGVDYTTCPRNAESWKFSASKIKLDHDLDRGYATNAILKVRGVPVFYIPYINFPLSGKRKSGFLTPSIRSSNESGLDLQIPYYLNLAPNQDATVAPRIIADRGEMLTGEYRYMGRTFGSQLTFEVLPSDDLAGGENRSSVSFAHQQRYADDRGYLNALIQNVSDAQYFEDFGHSLSVTSQRYLDRRIETTYHGQQISVYGIMQSYQDIDDSADGSRGPYRRIPKILAQTRFPRRHLTPHFYALSELTYFDRDASVTGARLDIEPTVSLPIIKPWADVNPALGVRYTDYQLTNSLNFDDHENRTVPVLSMDGQLFFERRFEFWDSRMLQTLEPRAFYLLIPKVGQSEFPVFDSGLFDFSFINLFRNNRFSGRDRIGDANQLALAVTSRNFSLESGHELFRTSLGQIYYFRDREIAVPGLTISDSSSSELIGEFATYLSDAWSGRVTMQWDPDSSRTNKSAFSVRYAPADGTIMNVAYRQRNLTPDTRRRALSDIEQADVSFRLPLTENLSVVGRWAYSLQNQQALEVVGGLEYESCCWGIRLFSRRFIRNVEGEFDNAIFIQAEFKGLGGLGRSASSFLRKSIPGYDPLF
ncbi:MAG: LPS-assembly protein LptD [Gammaproteobacteria bacterium]|nr:LPS-assembly protein LptD [Gammaproteobacteria bacterium]